MEVCRLMKRAVAYILKQQQHHIQVRIMITMTTHRITSTTWNTPPFCVCVCACVHV